MAELNPDMCASMTPADWLDVMPGSVKNYWAGSSGMDWGAPSAWVAVVNSLGVYGEYEMVFNDGGVVDTTKMLSYVKEYCGSDNKVMMMSVGSGLFTGGGHIVLATDISDDGKYFYITDSSTRAFGILNAVGEVSLWEEMSSFNFPINETGYCDYDYSFKGVWLIERKN